MRIWAESDEWSVRREPCVHVFWAALLALAALLAGYLIGRDESAARAELERPPLEWVVVGTEA